MRKNFTESAPQELARYPRLIIRTHRVLIGINAHVGPVAEPREHITDFVGPGIVGHESLDVRGADESGLL